MTRDFELAARQLRIEIDGSAELSADQRVDLRRRVDATLAEAPRWRGPWAVGGLAGAVAMAAAVAAFVFWIRPTPDASTWYSVQSGERCVSSAGDHGELRITHTSCGPVVIALGDDSVQMLSRGAIKRSRGAIRMIQGRARFQVKPRRRTQRRFRVLVSHGMIEALGTAFEVNQRRDDGQLRVTSGVVRFLYRDNTQVRVEAGEEIRWPRQKASEQPPAGEGSIKEKSEQRRRPRALGPRDPDTLLKRYTQLVSQRRYNDAVILLRDALRDRRLPRDHQARWSFQLGVLLEDSLGRREAACRHWREYVTQFEQQRWKDEVQERLRRCQGQ